MWYYSGFMVTMYTVDIIYMFSNNHKLGIANLTPVSKWKAVNTVCDNYNVFCSGQQLTGNKLDCFGFLFGESDQAKTQIQFKIIILQLRMSQSIQVT